MTELHVKQVYYPQDGMNPNSTLQSLLASYTWGRDADRLDGLSDQDIVFRCLRDLSLIHNRPLEFLKNSLRSSVVKRWASDEFTLAAYAAFDPFQYEELDDVLMRREGLISFAGEHTSSPHGWINTAIKTGIRAATEVYGNACGNGTKTINGAEEEILFDTYLVILTFKIFISGPAPNATVTG